MLNILILGEIVGIPTVKEIQKSIKKIIEKYKINFIIANADGASDGYGLLNKTANDLYKSGINVLTMGNFVFNKKDVKDLLKSFFLLRPFNLPNSHGGKGVYVYKINNNTQIAVINILGRINFNKIFASDPFYSVEKALEKIDRSIKNIIVDFHGGATSEIQAMQWYLAGRVTAVVGSHLRVLTSDNRIIKDKTAIITGTGYCGGYYSIGGLSPDVEIEKIKNGLFFYSKVVKENITLQGVIVEVDENTGNAKSISLLNEKIN